MLPWFGSTTEQFRCKLLMRLRRRGWGGAGEGGGDRQSDMRKMLMPCSGFDCENQYLLCLPSTFSHFEVKFPLLEAHVWQQGFSQRLHIKRPWLPLRWHCQSHHPVNSRESAGCCGEPVKVMDPRALPGSSRGWGEHMHAKNEYWFLSLQQITTNVSQQTDPAHPVKLPGLHCVIDEQRCRSCAKAPKGRCLGCGNALEHIALTPPPRGNSIRDTRRRVTMRFGE